MTEMVVLRSDRALGGVKQPALMASASKQVGIAWLTTL